MKNLSKAIQKSGNGQSYEQARKLSREYAQAQTEMEGLIEEWEQVAV